MSAHYGRLYNIRIPKSPRLYKRYRLQKVSHNTLFATILSLKLVSEKDVYSEFYHSLKALLAEYPIVDIRLMGFPANWEELLDPQG